MDYVNCIQQSIDFVEANLKEDISVEQLASLAGFSPYHFYRVFGAYVGMPVMEYIRCRRIAHAAAELYSHRRILDIAMDYGFQTHAGFTKAFQRVYGVPPDKYRLHATGCIPRKVILTLLAEYHFYGGIIVEPKIVTRPAFKVVGYALETGCENNENNIAIPKFWEQYMAENRGEFLSEQTPRVNDGEYGICFPADTKTGRFIYCIGVEVGSFEDISADLFTAEVPGATYAVFTTTPASRVEFSRTIQQTWQYIFNEWFPTSGYEFAQGCCDYEFYDERCMGEHNLVMDIYIPIVKR